jgi:hypothetical protein
MHQCLVEISGEWMRGEGVSWLSHDDGFDRTLGRKVGVMSGCTDLPELRERIRWYREVTRV